MSSSTRQTVRGACRDRQPLDGADAEALEHALTIAEHELDAARADLERERATCGMCLGSRQVYDVSRALVDCPACCVPQADREEKKDP